MMRYLAAGIAALVLGQVLAFAWYHAFADIWARGVGIDMSAMTLDINVLVFDILTNIGGIVAVALLLHAQPVRSVATGLRLGIITGGLIAGSTVAAHAGWYGHSIGAQLIDFGVELLQFVITGTAIGWAMSAKPAEARA